MIFLDFEKPIEELHQKIQELRHVQTEESALDISKEIDTLEKKSSQLLKKYLWLLLRGRYLKWLDILKGHILRFHRINN